MDMQSLGSYAQLSTGTCFAVIYNYLAYNISQAVLSMSESLNIKHSNRGCLRSIAIENYPKDYTNIKPLKDTLGKVQETQKCSCGPFISFLKS